MNIQQPLNIDRNALFEWIIQSTDDAIISKDLNGFILSWNKAAEHIFGYTEAEVINQHISLLIPTELRLEEEGFIQKIKADQVVDHYRTKRIKKDGSIIDVSLTLSPIKDLQGKIIGSSKILMDITEKMRAEKSIIALNQTIADSEKKFRTIIENNKDIITLMNDKYEVTYRSPSAIAITGYTEEEILERVKKGEVVNQLHPEDQSQILLAIQKVKEIPDVPIHVNFRSRHKDGHYIWLEGTITNFLDNPILKSIVNNFQDVTEKKESEILLQRSEKTYRYIASNIPGSVICMFDLEYRYTLIEGDLLENLGYEREKLLGKTIFELFDAKRLSDLVPLFRKVYSGTTFSIEERRGKYDTVSRYVPLMDNWKVYGAMVVVFDVSELKKTQHQLSELNQLLEIKIEERTAQLSAAIKELEAFSYSVSHDLRAPLRGIDGWSLALLEDYGDKLDARAHGYLERVRIETQRMGLLIDDLLKLSKLSKSEMKVSKVNLTELAQTICNRLQEEYAERNFEIHIKEGLEIMADSNLMEIMLTNLLGNAYKFTGKREKGEINFGCKIVEKDTIFYIQDNGSGFNIQNAKNLFGAFQRMHRQSEFPGSGIGLAIVQRIINLHQGKIWAESTEGEGSKFSFILNTNMDGK